MIDNLQTEINRLHIEIAQQESKMSYCNSELTRKAAEVASVNDKLESCQIQLINTFKTLSESLDEIDNLQRNREETRRPDNSTVVQGREAINESFNATEVFVERLPEEVKMKYLSSTPAPSTKLKEVLTNRKSEKVF